MSKRRKTKKTIVTPVSCDKEADIFVRQILTIGEAMYKAGGEISRIEDTLYRMGKAYGAKHVSVNAVTSSIMVTVIFNDDVSITQSRRIMGQEAVDCTKLEKLNQLCRQCASRPMDVETLRAHTIRIVSERPKSRYLYLGQLIGVMALTMYFGGEIQDSLVAMIGVALLCVLQRWVKPFCSSIIFFNVIASFATGIVVNTINLLVPGLHANQIMIGDLMVLIPGIAITNSIRYIVSGDMISSFEKLMDSVIEAFGIAAGFVLAIMCVNGTIIDVVPRVGMEAFVVKVIAAGVAVFGYCFIFNFRRGLIGIPVVGGVICCISFLLMQDLQINTFASVLVSSLIVGVYGEVFARVAKVPTTILFIPACIPLLPGSKLYYAAVAVMSQDWSALRTNIIALVLYAFGISIGLAVVVEIEKMVIKFKEHPLTKS